MFKCYNYSQHYHCCYYYVYYHGCLFVIIIVISDIITYYYLLLFYDYCLAVEPPINKIAKSLGIIIHHHPMSMVIQHL